MSEINPTRRTDEPPTQDGAPLAGWPTVITAEEAVALRGALGQLQIALDAVVRQRDEARAEVERLTRERNEAQSSCAYPDCVDLGPNGKCTKWLTGKCNPVLEAKS